MKTLCITTIAMVAVVSGEVMAAANCRSNTRVDTNAQNGGPLTTLIAGNTVCAQRGSERWQEQHRGGGQLWDYKLGTDPKDPTSQVGTWQIIGGTQISYSYPAGTPTYTITYSVHNEGTNVSPGPYSFCTSTGPSVTPIVSGATFFPGNASCP